MYRGAPSINNSRKCNTLWVGDLEPEIDEKYLRSVFGQNHLVKSIHIYKDKITNGKVNYAFVEFENPDIAEQVLHLFNGKDKPQFGKPFKINWGNQKNRRSSQGPMFGMNPPFIPPGGRFPNMPMNFPPGMPHGMMNPGFRGMPGMFPGMMPPNMQMGFRGNNFQRRLPDLPADETPLIHSVYVGDLDQFVEQHHLLELFKGKYKSVVGAKVIKDHMTKQNKGYGFVHFEDTNEADVAIAEMNGFNFMGRRIRTNRSFAKYHTSGLVTPKNAQGQPIQGPGMPGQGMPGQGMPGQGMPGQGMPGQGMMPPGHMAGMKNPNYPPQMRSMPDQMGYPGYASRQMPPSAMTNAGNPQMPESLQKVQREMNQHMPNNQPPQNLNPNMGHYRMSVQQGDKSNLNNIPKPSYVISSNPTETKPKPETSVEVPKTEDDPKASPKKSPMEENDSEKKSEASDPKGPSDDKEENQNEKSNSSSSSEDKPEVKAERKLQAVEKEEVVEITEQKEKSGFKNLGSVLLNKRQKMDDTDDI